MRKVLLPAVWVVLGNFLLIAIGFASEEFLALAVAAVVIEFILGFILLFNKDNRDTGMGLLLGVGLSFLIGLSVCTMAFSGFSVH